MDATTRKNKSLLTLLSRNDDYHKLMLQLKITISLSLVYVHFASYVMDIVPYWTFCIGVVIYISRWMINLHDYLHLVPPKKAGWFIRYHLLILTPLSFGYREIRDIHHRHHAYTVTEKDPDLYHIKGNFLTSFLMVTLSPEISTYHYIRDRGIDRELLLGMGVRFVLFMLLVSYLGMASLYYFIPVRLVYGACMFSISFPLHRKGKEYGTYTPQYPAFFQATMMAIFGKAVVNTLSHHDIHHEYPTIAATNLAKARRYFQPRSSTSAKPTVEEVAMPHTTT